MIKKVKIFHDSQGFDSLENQINEWMKENPFALASSVDVNVSNILDLAMYTAAVVYTDVKIQKENNSFILNKAFNDSENF